MEKEQFIKKMKEYNYTEEEITEMLNLIEENKNDGIIMKYEDILLDNSIQN